MKILSSIILSLSILLPAVSFSAEKKLSKEEFLQMMENGKISFDKIFLLPLQGKDKDGKTFNIQKEIVMGVIRQKNPNMPDEFFWILSRKTNEYQYTVFYDYQNRKCTYRAEKIVSSNSTSTTYAEVDPQGQTIDVKYCEMGYGVKIK